MARGRLGLRFRMSPSSCSVRDQQPAEHQLNMISCMYSIRVRYRIVKVAAHYRLRVQKQQVAITFILTTIRNRIAHVLNRSIGLVTTCISRTLIGQTSYPESAGLTINSKYRAYLSDRQICKIFAPMLVAAALQGFVVHKCAGQAMKQHHF